MEEVGAPITDRPLVPVLSGGTTASRKVRPISGVKIVQRKIVQEAARMFLPVHSPMSPWVAELDTHVRGSLSYAATCCVQKRRDRGHATPANLDDGSWLL